MAGSRSLLLWGGICFIYFLKIQISSSQEINACEGPKAINCGQNAECIPVHLSYNCTCAPGYALPSGNKLFQNPTLNDCEDQDECQNKSLCEPNGSCENTVGSYVCNCKQGFVKSSNHQSECIDVNECVGTNAITCGQNAECVNTPGSYHCTCISGYALPSGEKKFPNATMNKCKDVNECAAPTSISCGQNADCVNTYGSYHCTCLSGYALPSGEKTFPHVTMNACQGSSSGCFNLTKDAIAGKCGLQSNATNPLDGYKEICTSLKNLSHACENGKTSLSLENITTIFDSLLTQVNKNKAETAQTMTFYLETIQNITYDVALNLPPGRKNITENKLIAIQTLTVKGCDKNNSEFKMEVGSETMDFDFDCSLITENDSRGAAVFISYASIGSFRNKKFISKENLTTDDEELVNIYLNSKVVSGTIGYGNASSLSTSVNLTFQHIQMRSEKEKTLCVYWHNTGWSKQGCETIWYDDSRTICSCSHLSSFAVLMASTTLKEDFVLTVITYVGLGLSLLCLFLAALIFLLCRAIQGTSTSLHLQLSLCLFLANLLFLTGIKGTQPKILCSIIAGGLHYLYLAAFTWMFLEGLHLFLTVRNLKVANYTTASRFEKKFMYSFGYGIPAVIVAVSAAIGPQGYGTKDYCWLNLEKGFIWSFMGPVFIVILINLSFYLTTLWILRDRLSSLNKDVSTIKNTRVLTIKALAQLFILGCSWSLGFFLIESVTEPARSVIAYIFTIINSLQGVYIFLVHCVLSRQVQEEFKKCFKRIKKTTETDIYVLSTSTSHTKTLEK